ncbi:twin-arginine translocation signal domain-containing protein [Streptomyces endophyticus]|uniref:Twin-arginine translocation signal domain-containing protein n=1 Tax=Streptomyces endophyticus TaxID=714166 RepID=A0ABU6FH34_9ACTN|nr:twin-arginine translocation signal domain-containing protein [Streptomyces endophyticus]MEB8342102.1 twin-arginine translocation signal domain-containing protein [Streptomyces endophyticus]
MPSLPLPSRRRFLGAAGAIGAAAAFAGTGPAEAVDNDVVPIDWRNLGTYPGADAAGRRVKEILAGSSRYLIGPWYAATYTRYLPDGYIDLKGTDERAVRLPAMAAVAAATALTTRTYDERTLSAANATIRTRNLIRTLAARHRANNTDAATRWGGDWQTALWAYYTALAGWLMWDALDATDRGQVAAMLIWEADRLTTGNDIFLVGTSGHQLYMTRTDGTVVSPGDSKAEEENWSAAALSLAAVMMPGHPHHARWTRRNIELLLAAAACPADLTSDETINGIRLSSWLRGTNIADDGTLQNHARLHPLYMVAFDQSLYQGFVFGLANRAAPRAALHNIDRTYAALVEKPFALPDGGTSPIYRANSPEIYYPEGNDWGTHFPFYFGNFDLLVSLTGQDTGIDPAAAKWERLHNQDQLTLMSRFADGRTYGADAENTYYGREHRIGAMAGQAYLTLFLARNTTGNRLRWR